MSTYKITNITNLAGKRDFKFNSELDIEFIDNMIKKTIAVKPGNTIYLTIPSLPLSVHKLRIKGLISVVEISETELNKLNDINKTKSNIKKLEKELNVVKEAINSEKKSTKKKTLKKEEINE